MWLIKFIVGNLRKLNNEILFLEKYLEFSEKLSPENLFLYGRQDSVLGDVHFTLHRPSPCKIKYICLILCRNEADKSSMRQIVGRNR